MARKFSSILVALLFVVFVSTTICACACKEIDHQEIPYSAKPYCPQTPFEFGEQFVPSDTKTSEKATDIQKGILYIAITPNFACLMISDLNKIDGENVEEINLNDFKKEKSNFDIFALHDTRSTSEQTLAYSLPASTDTTGRLLNGIIEITIHLFDNSKIPPAVTFKTVSAFPDSNKRCVLDKVKIQWVNKNFEPYRTKELDLTTDLYFF